MLKFNNTHIFTGYLKQLLSSVNLPTSRIYTKEFARYYTQFGKEDPRVIESFDTFIYDNDQNKKRIAYRANYLKGNELFHYFWPLRAGQKFSREDSRWQQSATVFYDKDKCMPGLTKILNSPGNVYDTATHEYLGDYLRFLRDYYDINLMSMYNCFSNTAYSNIYTKVKHINSEAEVVFDSRDSRYCIYAFPVKLFCDYTIAIDCSQEIEMFCGLYNATLDASAKARDLGSKTYKRVNGALFRQPFLYDKLNVKYWNFEQDTNVTSNCPKFVNNDLITRWDIANREQDLRLFIKVPVLCKSSIVVLEGDYREFNDSKYERVRLAPSSDNQSSNETEPQHSTNYVWEYKQNHAILNFGDAVDIRNGLDLNESPFNPIGRLQLLALNTGESYPFSDRLIEYLCGSAITPIDEIPDNIKRVQKVMTNNRHYFKIDGIWEDKMQKIIYDYIINSGPIELLTDAGKTDSTVPLIDRRRGYHPRLGHYSKSILYDVTGFVDRDAEKWYASWTKQNGSAQVTSSIQNVDIYNGLFDLK